MICYWCGVTLNASTGHARREMVSNTQGTSITFRGNVRLSGYSRTVRRSLCFACANAIDRADGQNSFRANVHALIFFILIGFGLYTAFQVLK
jgi:hypothetical protein